MSRNHLASLNVGAFMQTYWQQKPLLVREAFSAFKDPLTFAEVKRLAGREEAQSRLIMGRGKRWGLEHGPISAARFKQLPSREWTVLVQDTNHFSREASELLSRFDFIPHARIDDVMVSYAVPGGSVGPHVDSYDVFLLQGRGRRRWQISSQNNLDFTPGLPLKILRRFQPEQEWVLEPGDMLYLPPGVAHHGVAETECLTWSIGFRSPSDSEWVTGFLDYLRESLAPVGHYADPGSRPAKHAGEIPPRLLAHARKALANIRWDGATVREFAGRFLTEPKAHVYFDAPRRALTRAHFVAAARRHGIALDSKSRFAFSGTIFFVNGEAEPLPAAARTKARQLADLRRLEPGTDAPPAFWEAAHRWYLQGFVLLEGGRG